MEWLASTATCRLKARVLVLHGAADPLVAEEQVEAFKKEMATAKVDLKFIAYPEVLHSFTDPGATKKGKEFDLPLAYDKTADRKSWKALKTFLGEIFRE